MWRHDGFDDTASLLAYGSVMLSQTWNLAFSRLAIKLKIILQVAARNSRVVVLRKTMVEKFSLFEIPCGISLSFYFYFFHVWCSVTGHDLTIWQDLPVRWCRGDTTFRNVCFSFKDRHSNQHKHKQKTTQKRMLSLWAFLGIHIQIQPKYGLVIVKILNMRIQNMWCLIQRVWDLGDIACEVDAHGEKHIMHKPMESVCFAWSLSLNGSAQGAR